MKVSSRDLCFNFILKVSVLLSDSDLGILKSQLRDNFYQSHLLSEPHKLTFCYYGLWWKPILGVSDKTGVSHFEDSSKGILRQYLAT